METDKLPITLEDYQSAKQFVEEYNEQYNNALDFGDFATLEELEKRLATRSNDVVRQSVQAYIDPAIEKEYSFTYSDYIKARFFIEKMNTEFQTTPERLAAWQKHEQTEGGFSPAILITFDAESNSFAINSEIEVNPPKPEVGEETLFVERMKNAGFPEYEIAEELEGRHTVFRESLDQVEDKVKSGEYPDHAPRHNDATKAKDFDAKLSAAEKQAEQENASKSLQHQDEKTTHKELSA